MPSYHPVVALLRPAQTLQLLPVQKPLQLPDDLVGHQKATGRQAPALLRPLGQAVVGVNLQPCAQGVEAPAEAVSRTP